MEVERIVNEIKEGREVWISGIKHGEDAFYLERLEIEKIERDFHCRHIGKTQTYDGSAELVHFEDEFRIKKEQEVKEWIEYFRRFDEWDWRSFDV